MHLLTATKHMMGTKLIMNIHNTCDDNEETMRADGVSHCRVCDQGELTTPPQCGRMHQIRM